MKGYEDLKINSKKIGNTLWSDEPKDIIPLKNPVLNGMLMGGIAKGAITQFISDSGVGKSTLVSQIVKELCEQGYNVVYIDAEGGLNINNTRLTGIDKFIENNDPNVGGRLTIIRQNNCGIINNTIQDIVLNYRDEYRNNRPLADFFVLDSIGTLDSGLYDLGKGDLNNPKVGGDLRSIRALLNVMNGLKLSSDVGFILINHIVRTINTYVPQEKPSGGNFVKYVSDVIIKLGSGGKLEYDVNNDFSRIYYEAVKSRWQKGKAKVPFVLRLGQGIAIIPTAAEVLDKVPTTFNGTETTVIERRGGGNGSLYINNKEYKFRGERQLLTLIGEHIRELVPFITPDLFRVQDLPDTLECLKEEPTDIEYNTEVTDTESIVDYLPESLKSLEIKRIFNGKVYFEEGIDSKGIPYSIYYEMSSKTMFLEFNNTSQGRPKSGANAYRDFMKKLNIYLESLK